MLFRSLLLFGESALTVGITIPQELGVGLLAPTVPDVSGQAPASAGAFALYLLTSQSFYFIMSLF